MQKSWIKLGVWLCMVEAGLCDVQAQQSIHLFGVMPTVDVGASVGEGWHVENYSFACILPVEQLRPSFGETTAMDAYGPGEVEDGRNVRALVFAYTECDVTRTLNEAWSMTASYTHEWVPSNVVRVEGLQRDTRNEHRAWLQSKYQHKGDKLSLWWRMRWDQRFIEDLELHAESRWLVRPRWRQQLGASVDLGQGSLVASTEGFVEAWEGANVTSGEDRFREAWSSLQYGRVLNDRFRWEVGPLVVSWKKLGAEGSLGWEHYCY
ncbi:MAG: DUF2490 domain-containing protein, partial [Flavobacteriales bacterium]